MCTSINGLLKANSGYETIYVIGICLYYKGYCYYTKQPTQLSGASVQGEMEVFLNTTNSTTSRPFGDNITTVAPYSGEGGHLTVFESAAVIAILAILVVMAILFTIYGLFMKAEAHKHSIMDTIGMEGYKDSLMFSGQDASSPWHSDHDAAWP